jgi:type IV pilus assembly protein PilA
MMKKRGFTLIELLAVIVILAIILVIAVPQILGVIDQARRDSLASSVRMYASAIETTYMAQIASGGTTVAEGTDQDCPTGIATWDTTNGTCTYSLSIATSIPTVTVTIVGAGKFDGLTAAGGKTGTVTVTNTVTP